LYFTVKDADAALKCVMWRTYAGRLRFQPRDGDAVVLHGRVTVYELRGEYQLQVDLIQPEGMGLLYQAYEALKQRLEVEGLFDVARKRPLPRFPERIGVVTSAAGAALRDILTVLNRRYPLVEVVLAPAAVQGLDAPAEIVAGLDALNQLGDVDVIIVARGGGSLEDLWAFNDEAVARAIAASRTPVISAVGHETDFTIADFVADVRAPTPSAAAELAVPDGQELSAGIAQAMERMDQAVRRLFGSERAEVAGRQRLLRRYSPLQVIARQRQRVDDLVRSAELAAAHRVEILSARARELRARLSVLSPYATLDRGYAIVRTDADGRILDTVAKAVPGLRLRVQVCDGEFGAVVASRATRGPSR
jgi:exodeoxyribonuclease VII large subunit